MLALSHQHGLTQHTITMVAALSLQEVLLETPIGNHEDAFNKRDLAQIRHKWANNGNTTRLLGDPMVLLSAVYNTEYNGCTREFCDRHGLRFKAMQEIRKLRRQLANELSNSGLKVILDPKIQAPNDQDALLLRQILLAGMLVYRPNFRTTFCIETNGFNFGARNYFRGVSSFLKLGGK